MNLYFYLFYAIRFSIDLQCLHLFYILLKLENLGRNENSFEEVDYSVSLNVRYKTIKRILVGLINKEKINGCETIFALQLYFHLSAPPIIRRIKIYPPSDDKKKSPNLMTKFGDRFTAWDRRSSNMSAEINDSPILRLVIYNVNVSSFKNMPA